MKSAPLLDPSAQHQDCVTRLDGPQQSHFRKLDSGPRATNDSLAIAVGETLCLNAKIAGDNIVDFRVVGPEFPKDQTMRITLRVDRGVYLLALFNPTPKWLRYRAWVTPKSMDEKQAAPTSVFPVAPGLTMVQTWMPATGMSGLILDSFEVHDSPGNGPAGPAAPVVGGTPTPPVEDCVPQMNLPAEQHFLKGHDAAPGVSNDSIAVGLGETLCLDATESAGKLVDFHTVGPDFPKAKTMKVQLTQMQGSYVLVIRNPTARTLRYRAVLLMRAADGSVKHQETDVVPVRPGLTNFESWPVRADMVAVGIQQLEVASP